MYEIREKFRTFPDGTEITTYTREVINANILEVEAGTTGLMGGNSSHGGRTYFRVEDIASTDMEIRSYGSKFNGSGFEVILGGDTELDTMIEALKFIVQALEDAHDRS